MKKSRFFIGFLILENKYFFHYFSEIALTGHVPTHVRQLMHVASSHSDFPSPSRDKAVTGQAPTQAPHPMQVSLSTVTGMFVNPPYD